MKKLLSLLFAGICLPISMVFGQDQTYSQEKPKNFYNLWGVKSVGVYGNSGGEKFFKPLTFDYFNRNSGYKFPQYFVPPPGNGNGTGPTEPFDQVIGSGIELAWPVGKKHNEIRVGLSVQDHSYPFYYYSHYNITPDTVRLHTITLHDDYLISQASFDYVFYSKPILKHFRFLWRTGCTLGFSIPTKNKFDHFETYGDIETSRAFFNPDGSFASRYSPPNSYFQYTNIDSNTRLEAGLRTSVGLELMLNFLYKEIGISGEYGHGLAGQKVLKGGTTDFKRTELKQIQIRFFLR